MEFSGETQVFFSLMLTACLLGSIFDVYRTARNFLKLKTLSTALADFFYWVFAALLVFAVLIYVNEGQIRFYVFLALLAGALLYFNFCSKYVLLFFRRLLKLVSRAQAKLQHVLHTLFTAAIVKPYRYVSERLLRPFKMLARSWERLYRQLYKLLKN